MSRRATGYAPEIVEFPQEVLDAWGWIIAFDAWDHGDAQPLADMILREPVPEKLRPALAKRISGEIKPNKRASAHQRITAQDRIHIAMFFSTAMYLSKANETFGLGPDDEQYIEWQADRSRREVAEVKREMQRYRRVAAQKVAERFGVSIETLENIMRGMRKKAREYPDV